MFFLALTFVFLKAAETGDVDKPPHSSLGTNALTQPKVFEKLLTGKPQILVCPESPIAASLPSDGKGPRS